MKLKKISPPGPGSSASDRSDHSLLVIIFMLLVVFAPVICVHTYFAYFAPQADMETVHRDQGQIRPKPANG